MGKKNNGYDYRVLCALRRVIRSVDIYSKKLNTELGLTTPQLLCLHALANSECMILSDLAKEINLGVSTVNGIVDRLEAKQLVTRKRSAEDRRRVELEITSCGKQIVLKSPSLLQDKLSASLSRLPESDQLAITESLELVVKLMEAEKVDASPNLFPSEQVGNNE
jgi:MarR family transcriptional regulator, organic hydroperoxide resistance regulator